MNLIRYTVRYMDAKKTLCILVAFTLYVLFTTVSYNSNVLKVNRLQVIDYVKETSCIDLQNHTNIIDKFFSPRKNWRTSNLGAIMFKNIYPEVFIHESRQDRNFTVLLWKHWARFSSSHAYVFNNIRAEDVLGACSVKNCVFSRDTILMNTADAVVVHVQQGEYPKAVNRSLFQRWIFLSDLDPLNTFLHRTKNKTELREFANLFNWTMTYRSNADIPVPSGRTVPLANPIAVDMDSPYQALKTLVPFFKKKKMDVAIAILASNCYQERMYLLNEFQKHTRIDVYGRCGTTFKNACPGHFRKDCPAMSEYFFYLVLENTSCKQYLTEKVYQHAYAKGSIPIIIGPPLEDCEKLLPPNSFIHVDNFETLDALATELERIAFTYENLLYYHTWRRHFRVTNEHGYFETEPYHYCRICEALNYNDGEISSYDLKSLNLLFDAELLCGKLKHIESVRQTL